MFHLAQMPQMPMPDLPEGPSLDTLRGPVEIPAYAPWQINLMIAGSIILLGLLVWGVYRFIKRKKQPKAQALYAVFKSELSSAIDPALLSKALRNYLQSLLGSRSIGASSKELIALAARHPAIKSSTLAQLDPTLHQLDHLKFAPQDSKAVEPLQPLIDTARTIVEAIEAERQKIETKMEDAS